MKKLFFTFVFILFTFSYATNIEVVTENYPPYQWKENTVITGPSTEIIQALIKKVGTNHTIKMYPWARSYHLALSYENILIYSIRRIKERERLFKWIGVLRKNSIYFWKLKSRTDIKIASLSEAKKYRVGTLNKDAKSLFLLSHGFVRDKNLVVLNDNERIIKLLYAKRTDLLIDSTNVLAMAKKLGYNSNLLEKVYLVDEFPINMYAAFSLMTNDIIVDKFRKALEELKNEGEFDRILNKYK